MKQITYQLQPNTSQKSFYGKAIVSQLGNEVQLTSYQTTVAEINTDKREIKLNGYYSTTTAKHIRAFCSMYTDEAITKKQMEDRVTIKY